MDTSRIPSAFLRLIALCTLAAISSAQAKVLIVDNSVTGGLTTIQAGVDLAVAGDVVLLKPGTGQSYGSFRIDGKGISVVGDGRVDVTGPITVENIGGLEHVTLSNLDIAYPPSQSGITLGIEVIACDGPVWLEGLNTNGTVAAFFNSFVSVDSSGAVILNHCMVNKDQTIETFGLFPSHGFVATSSLVLLLDTSLDGIPGQDAVGTLNSGHGGDALHLIDSVAFAAGLSAAGGDGGNGGYLGIGCVEAKDGGNGATVDSTSILDYLDSAFIPGLGGVPCNALHPPGEDGVPIEGVSNDLGNSFRNLTISSPTRGGEFSTLQVSALSNELAFLLFDPQPQFISLLQFDGYLLLPLVPSIQALGLTDASGGLTQYAHWPDFPAVLDVLEFYAQLVVIDSSGAVVLGGASALHVVNQAF